MEEIKNFFNDYAALFSGRILTIFLGVLSFTLVIRILAPEQFGLLNLFLSVGQIGLLLSVNWTTNAMIRFGKEELLEEKSIKQTFWSRVLIVSFVLPLFFLGLYIFRDKLVGYIGLPLAQIWVVFIYFLALAFASIVLYPFQALGRMKTFSFIPVWEKGLYVLFLLLIIAGIIPQKTIFVIWSIIIASVFSSLVAWLMFPKEKILPAVTSRKTIRKVFRFAWPSLCGGSAGYVVNWIDIIVIKMFLTSAVVGIYSVAYGIYSYLMTLLLVASNLLSLMLTAFLVRKREDLVVRYVKRVIPQVTFFWSCFVSVILVAIEPVANFWVGAKYISAIMPLQILIAGLVFRAVICAYTPIYSAYLMSGRYHLANIIIACINCIGDLILIPRYGMVGASISTTIAFLICSFLLTSMANRRLRIVQYRFLFYSLPAVLSLIIVVFLKGPAIRVILFNLVLMVSIYLSRKFELFKKEDIAIFDSIRMPLSIKIVSIKIINIFFLSKEKEKYLYE